jgi:hypothetical protein
MSEAPNLDKLIEESIRNAPDELQAKLRHWLSRAKNGQLSDLNKEMLRRADDLWDAFDEAAKKVEKKLQQ